jgi:hypothetical protein
VPAAEVAAAAQEAPKHDAFPHTRRPLPWVLAGFLWFLFFVPVDQTTVKVHLPFSSYFDRFLVVLMVLAWIVFRGDQRTVWKSRRSRIFVGAAALFLFTLVVGDFANSPRAINMNEWTLATKQLTLVATLMIVGWFTLTALRPEDLPGFSKLIVIFGTGMAIGMLVESRTGYNVFFNVSTILLSPIAHVGAAGTNLNAAAQGVQRAVVVGPTAHGLCAVTVLAIALPFALVRLFDAKSARQWLCYAMAVALMASAAIATQEKTGFLALVGVFLFIMVHRPLKMLKLVPFMVVMLGFVHAAAPGSLGTVLDISRWFNNGSSAHRAADLTAIWPDVLTHPLFGRGYGTVNVAQAAQFRIMDDQFLGMLWQTGFLGLAAYCWMILSPIAASTKARLSRDPHIAPVALAASAGCVAFFIVNWLFDALGFVQGPYLFFIIAAMATVASGANLKAPAPKRAPARHPQPIVVAG